MTAAELRIRPVPPLADVDLDPVGLLAALPYAIVVLDGDSLWRIASREMGSGALWESILEVAAGSQNPLRNAPATSLGRGVCVCVASREGGSGRPL